MKMTSFLMTSFLILLLILFIASKIESKKALRIYGGKHAKRDEYPYVVRIDSQEVQHAGRLELNSFSVLCSGTALSDTWTLTASHCLDGISESFNFYVRYNSFLPSIEGNVSKVINFYPHPRYIDGLYFRRYDIALLETDKITISSFGKLSALDYPTLIGQEALILGFGIANSTTEPPLQILKGMLSKCTEKHKGLDYMFAPMCFNVPCGTIASPLSGDAGGPVLHASGVVGVDCMRATSYNYATGKIDRPHLEAAEFVTTVSTVLDWIFEIMKEKIKE